MKRLIIPIITTILVAVFSQSALSSGSPARLFGYATSGANPTVTFIVTDQYGNGAQGIPITVTSSAGVLDVTANSTAADGTMTVTQTGGNLGDNIVATCSQVTSGSPYTITSAVSQPVTSTDTVLVWFDESRRIFNAVAVTSGIGVLTSNSNFNFYIDDNSSNYKYLTIGERAGISQGASTPAQVEVYQGTYTPGDRVYVNETTVSNNPSWYNGDAVFSSTQPSHFLYAYAVDGASPTICAVVTDFNGIGVAGVTVNVTCTAGTFATTSDTTNDNGVACFYQLAGSLGDTITASCPGLPETSSVNILTENSQTLATSNKIFSWFERKTRMIYTAVVNRETNVLVSSAPVSRSTPIDINSNDIDPSQGSYVDQTSMKPAISYLAFGTSEAGDLLRIYQTTVYRYPSYYHSQLEIPANENQYLMAFATGGANPEVWAVVTDESGNAVRGVDVTFSLQGTGTLDFTSATTTWNGVTRTAVSGASGIGNTITVSATGLGEMKIYTSASEAVSSTDRVYGWYDPETHKVFGAVVNIENNVLLENGTNITDRNTLDKTSGNNYPTISSFGAQTGVTPCQAHIGFGTIEAGDYIRLNQTTTSADWDVIIIADPDPAKFLLAFAEGGAGADVRVWAVVMDNKCTGLEGENVSFATVQGSMSPTDTVTGYGGFVVSLHNSGVLDNTITVSAPGLPPVKVITAVAVGGTGDDWGLAWYDAARLTIWGIITTRETNIITSGSSYSNPINIYDNSSNNKTFDVNGYVGHNMTRIIYPLNQWTIAFGTPGVGDEVTVNMGWTSNNPDVFIRVGEIKSSYLRAYAQEGISPPIKAIVVDSNGVGIEGVTVNFATTGGSILPAGPGITGYDGTIDKSKSGGAVSDVVTVSSAGYPDVQIYISNSSNNIRSSSPTIVWYNSHSRKLCASVIEYPYYNITVSETTPDISYIPVDNSDNGKIVAITDDKEDSYQEPTYAYVAQGTSGSGDQIRVQTTVTQATDDAVVTLPIDTERYLWAFARGGVDPAVWAAVTDEKGNGIADVPVRFITGGGPMSLTETVTDASGSTVSVQSGGSIDDEIYVSADGVANTITVKTANAWNREGATRAMAWYDKINRIAHTAFINVPNNVMALATNATYTAVTTTPIGDPIEVFGTVQQTATDPSYTNVSVTANEGDQVWVSEPASLADPDAILTLQVPTAGIDSLLTAAPAQVSIGQDIIVTMSVLNSGSPGLLTVTPSPLGVLGGANLVSGPVPTYYNYVTGGAVENFIWTYSALTPGDAYFSGQAFGVDSFSMLPVSSQSTTSNAVTIQVPPSLVAVVSGPDNAQRLEEFTVTVTVSNNGQAAAQGVVPADLTLTAASTTTATTTTAYAPAAADIPGGESREFTRTYRAGETGVLQFRGGATGYDANSGNTVTAAAANSNLIQVIQGALNINRIASPANEVYQGQRGIAVSLEARNTSLLSVTLTAATLRFNDQQAGFVVRALAGNPTLVPAQSTFTLSFEVDVGQDAPLGSVVINGTLSGDSAAGAMTAVSADQTATWQVKEALNQMRQNYPNPLRLSQQAFTTFEYFVREEKEVSIKIYNLSGELVAVLVEGSPGVGRYSVVWYGDNGSPSQRGKTVGSGVYLAVYKSGDYQEIKKVVVIR